MHLGTGVRARKIRPAMVEQMERRALLAVSAAEYDSIRAMYPEFGLPANMADVNVIEIAPADLDMTNLQSAIMSAQGTTLPNLIVARTTDTQNRIGYATQPQTGIFVPMQAGQGALSIVGFGTQPLTLDAERTWSVLTIGGDAGSRSVVNLGGMTLTGGYVGEGAGILVDYTDLTLKNVTITGNTAFSTGGGGIEQYYGNLVLTNVTISGNTTAGPWGGGGLCQYYGTSTLTNVTISGNTADEERGGGMANLYGTATLTNVMISGNTAGEGAGFYQWAASTTMTNVTISRNFATWDGGGMYNEASASSTLANCAFTGNEAYYGEGGGMYNKTSSPMLTNCTFTGNSAGLGGGMSNFSSSPKLTNCIFTGNTAMRGGALASSGGSPNLTNSSFSVNTAEDRGGAIYAAGSGLTLTNCTLSDSFSRLGSAIYSDSAAPSPFSKLTNCIVWGTWGGSPIAIASDSRAPLITYSDIEGGYSGTGNIDADPQFIRTSSPGADGFYGTEDDDYGDLRLQSTSLCIDAGNSAASGLSGITTDITGGPRITGGIVDMGAYELDTIAPTITSVAINDGALQRSMVRRLSVTFSEPVTLSFNALAVKLSTGQAVPNTTITITNPSADQTTYVLIFSGTGVIGGSLADGIYDLLISAAGVQDLTGNSLAASYSHRFHRLFGDSDGNKVVNALDYARMNSALGRVPSDPLFNSAFDYEGNGLINALDLARFRQRYGLVYSY